MSLFGFFFYHIQRTYSYLLLYFIFLQSLFYLDFPYSTLLSSQKHFILYDIPFF